MVDERLNPNWGNDLKAATNAAGEVVGVLKPQSDSLRAPVVVATTDAVTGVSTLSASGANLMLNTSKSFPSYAATQFQYSATPTKFFDPTATSSANTGTLANPYNSWATVSAALTGDQHGVVLGIKSGITHRITAAMTLGLAGTMYSPFAIVPYGGSALPIISALSVLTGWTSVGGGIYSRLISTEIASGGVAQPAIYEFSTRFLRAASYAAMAAGTYFYDAAGNNGPGGTGAAQTVYIWPQSGSPELGQVEMSRSAFGLDIALTDKADTGYVIVSGIELKGGGTGDFLRIAPAGVGSITSMNGIAIMGCKITQCGVDVASGNNSAIGIGGASNAVRSIGLYVGGIYVEDTINNAVEIWGHDKAIIEYVETNNIHGKLIELWASTSNCQIRYNKAVNSNYTGITTFIGSPVCLWQAPYKLTQGVGAGTFTTDSTVSNTNTFHHNLLLGFANQGLLMEAGSGHKVHHNTFITTTGAMETTTINRWNSGVTGCEFSNNFTYSRSSTANIAFMWARTGVTGLSGDYNIYASDASTTVFGYSDNGAARATLAAWITAMGVLGETIDTNSKYAPANVNTTTGLPYMSSPVKGFGATTLGYLSDALGNPHANPPSAGAIEAINGYR